MLRTLAFICLLLALTIVLHGCTAGALGLTGGSVPIGDIDGWLYASSSRASAPVAGVPVELVNRDGVVVATTISGGDGRFSFREVRAPDYCLTVRAQQRELLACLEIDFLENEHAQVQLALLLAPAVAQPIVGMVVTPAAIPFARTGEPVRLRVQGITSDPNDQDHLVDNLPVSWAVKGNIGVITPDGLFTPTTPGAGTIIAQYQRVKGYVAIQVN